MKQGAKDTATASFSVIWIGAAIVALIFIVGGGLLLFDETLGLARKNVSVELRRANNEYVDAKQALLLELVVDAEDPVITTGQRRAIHARICEERTKIEERFSPRPVEQYVLQEGICS